MEISLRRKLLSFVLVLSLLLQMVAPVFLSFAETPEEPPATEVEVETQDEGGEPEESTSFAEPAEEALEEDEEEVQGDEEAGPVDEPQEETQDEEEDSEDSATGGEENTESEEKEEPSDEDAGDDSNSGEENSDGPLARPGIGTFSIGGNEIILGDDISLTGEELYTSMGDFLGNNPVDSDETIKIDEDFFLILKMIFSINDGYKVADGDYFDIDISNFLNELPDIKIEEGYLGGEIEFNVNGNTVKAAKFELNQEEGKIRVTFDSSLEEGNLEELNKAHGRVGFVALGFASDEAEEGLPLVTEVEIISDKNYTFERENPFKEEITKESDKEDYTDGDQIIWEIDVNKPLKNLTGAEVVDTLPSGLEVTKVEIANLNVTTNSATVEGDYTTLIKNIDYDVVSSDDVDILKIDLSDLEKEAKRIRVTTKVKDDFDQYEKITFKNKAQLTYTGSSNDLVDDKEVVYDRFPGIEKEGSLLDNTNRVKWEIEFLGAESETTLTDILTVPKGVVIGLDMDTIKLEKNGELIGSYANKNVKITKSEAANDDSVDYNIVFSELPAEAGVLMKLTYETEYFFDYDKELLGVFTLVNKASYNQKTDIDQVNLERKIEVNKGLDSIFHYEGETYVQWAITINPNNEPWKNIVLEEYIPAGFVFTGVDVYTDLWKEAPKKIDADFDEEEDHVKITLQEAINSKATIYIYTKLDNPSKFSDELIKDIENKVILYWDIDLGKGTDVGTGEDPGNPGGELPPRNSEIITGSFDKSKLVATIDKNNQGESINYETETAYWGIKYKTYTHKLENFVIEDKLDDDFTDGQGSHVYNNDSFQLKLNGLEFEDLKEGNEKEAKNGDFSVKYSLTFDDDKRLFQFKIINSDLINDFANDVELLYTTSFKLSEMKSLEKGQITLKNSAEVTNGGKGITTSKEQKLTVYVSKNGHKYGALDNDDDKYFNWTVNFNYRSKKFYADLLIKDTLSAGHKLVDGSIKIYKAEITEKGELEKTGEDFKEFVLVSPSDDEFSYAIELKKVVDYPLIIEYKTVRTGISKDEYSNSVTFEEGINHSKTVKYEPGSIVEKNLDNPKGSKKDTVYEGDILNWTININEDRSEIYEFELKDTIEGGLKFIDGSLKIIDVEADEDVTDEFTFQFLDDNDGFSLTKPVVDNESESFIDKHYIVTYKTIVTAELGSKITNKAVVTGKEIEEDEESSGTYNVSKWAQSGGVGTINYGEDEFGLKIIKTDDKGERITSSKASFLLTVIMGQGDDEEIIQYEVDTSAEDNEIPDVDLGEAQFEMLYYGKNVEYYVKETSAPNGYIGKEYGDDDEYGEEVDLSILDELEGEERVITFTVVNYEMVKVEGKKSWYDDDSKDRPAEIEIKLTRGTLDEDGNFQLDSSFEEIKSVTSDDDWSFEFTDLLKYDDDKNEYHYRVEEVGVPAEYSVIYSDSEQAEDYALGQYDIANVRKGETEVIVNKIWKDDDNKKNLRPNKIEVKLTRKIGEDPDEDFEITEGIAFSSSYSWRYTFDKLDKYDSLGKLYTYEVEEIVGDIEGDDRYEVTYEIDGYNYDIINTLTGTTKVEGTKFWRGRDENSPDSVTIGLKANGTPIEVETTDALEENDWKYEFTDLDKYDSNGNEIDYSVYEVDVPDGYNSSTSNDGLDITNTRSLKKSIEITKNWLDAGDKDGVRPESIQVELWRSIDNDPELISDLKLTKEHHGVEDYPNTWKYTTGDLEFYDENGRAYTYTLVEKVPDGYEVVENGELDYSITNRRFGKTSVKVNKEWIGGPENRPEVTLQLLQNGTPMKGKQITLDGTEDTPWQYTWEDLDEFDELGARYEYSVRERGLNREALRNYRSRVTGNMEEGFTVTNRYVSPRTNIRANKVWDGGNPNERPAVYFTLYRQVEGKDPEKVGTRMVPRRGNQTLVWRNLPETDFNANPYTYYVEETDRRGNKLDLNNYDSERSEDGLTITNTYVIPKTDIRAEKIWEGGSAIERPEIYFTLYRQLRRERPEKLDTRLVEEVDGQYLVVWEDMDETNFHGRTYTYFVRETDEDGNRLNLRDQNYRISGSGRGLEVTNTYVIPRIDISAEKIWDGGNPDKRPEIYFTLHRKLGDEEDKSFSRRTKQVPTEENEDGKFLVNWKYLKKTDFEGREYTYYVVETDVEGNRLNLSEDNYISEENGLTITNSYVSPEIEIKAEKIWVGDTLDNRPLATFKLYRSIPGGEKELVEKENVPVELDEDGKYKITWTVDKTDRDAVDYDYWLEEVELDRYNSVLEGDMSEGFVVTNTRITYAIGDYTWIDKNKDGIQDKDEEPLVGVKVELYDEENNLLKTTTTDDRGFYLFDELDAGNYRVRFVLTDEQAKKYKFTKLNAGKGDEVGDDSDADPKTGWTKLISLDDDNKNLTKAEDYKTNKVLATQGIDPTWDAGVIVKSYAIGDYTWIDKNKDGIQDKDEEPLVGVKVELYGEDGKLLATTTTDKDGFYLFDKLEAGKYKIRFVLTEEQAKKYRFTKQGAGADKALDSDADEQTGWTREIVLDDTNKYLTKDYRVEVEASEGIDPTWDAGVIVKSYAIGDYTWIDKNKDGIQDKDEESLAGVKVELYDEDGKLLATTTTDKDGYYLFDELAAGRYRVKFTLTKEQAKRYKFTKLNSGDDTSLDSDAIEATGWTRIIVLNDDNKYLTKTYRTDVKASEGIDPTWDAGVVEIEKTLPSTGAAPMGGLLMGGLGLLGAALVLLRKKED